MSIRVNTVAGTLALFSGVGLAQPVETFHYPRILMWSPLLPTGWDNSDRYLRNTIYLETFDATNHVSRSAATVAGEAKTAMLAYRGSYTAAERPITIFLKNFGRDEIDHDYKKINGVWTSTNWSYDLRFFRVQDRLPNGSGYLSRLGHRMSAPLTRLIVSVQLWEVSHVDSCKRSGPRGGPTCH